MICEKVNDWAALERTIFAANYPYLRAGLADRAQAPGAESGGCSPVNARPEVLAFCDWLQAQAAQTRAAIGEAPPALPAAPQKAE